MKYHKSAKYKNKKNTKEKKKGFIRPVQLKLFYFTTNFCDQIHSQIHIEMEVK